MEEKVFKKTGQIKVTQNPKNGLKKLAKETEIEYGIDDLVEDSKKEQEDVSTRSDQ